MNSIFIGNPGVCSPFGGTDATWQALMAGHSGIGPVSKFGARELNMPTQVASEVMHDLGRAAEELGLRQHTLEREASDFVLHALYAAHESLGQDQHQAAITSRPLACGIALGSGGGGLPDFETLAAATQAGYPADRKVRLSNMLRILKFLINMPTGQLSLHYRLRGPSETLGDACAAGLKAIINAARIIRLGEASLMLAGGTEGTINRTAFAAFNLMDPRGGTGGAMSLDNTPEASRPFQHGRDGFVMGEGAATCVLTAERTPHSLAELAGWASSGDAHSMYDPPKDGQGAYDTMAMALERAQTAPHQVDAVVAHGTSTPNGDAAECQALRRLFGGHAEQVMVYGPKGSLGHWLGASGPLGVWVALMALQTQRLPLTRGLTPETLDPACAGVGHLARGRPIATVLVNAFGFGGTNASVVLKSLPA